VANDSKHRLDETSNQKLEKTEQERPISGESMFRSEDRRLSNSIEGFILDQQSQALKDDFDDGSSEDSSVNVTAGGTEFESKFSRRAERSPMSSVIGDDSSFYKKYLSAADFIEIQILNGNKSVRHAGEFLNIFVALLDRIDFNRAAQMILECDHFDQFLKLEKICSVQRKHKERELLIEAMFTQATKMENEPLALMLALEFESVLLRTTQVVVPVILSRFDRKDFVLNEMKLFIL